MHIETKYFINIKDDFYEQILVNYLNLTGKFDREKF